MRDDPKVFVDFTETFWRRPSSQPIFSPQILNSISTNMRPGRKFMFDSIMELPTCGFARKVKLGYSLLNPSRASHDDGEFFS